MHVLFLIWLETLGRSSCALPQTDKGHRPGPDFGSLPMTRSRIRKTGKKWRIPIPSNHRVSHSALRTFHSPSSSPREICSTAPQPNLGRAPLRASEFRPSWGGRFFRRRAPRDPHTKLLLSSEGSILIRPGNRDGDEQGNVIEDNVGHGFGQRRTNCPQARRFELR